MGIFGVCGAAVDVVVVVEVDAIWYEWMLIDASDVFVGLEFEDDASEKGLQSSSSQE